MIEGTAIWLIVGGALFGATYLLTVVLDFIATDIPDFWHDIHKKDGQP